MGETIAAFRGNPQTQLYYYDTQLSRPAFTSPWERLSSTLLGDPGNMVMMYDDMQANNSSKTLDTWQVIKGTGGNITVNNTDNGYISIPTAASASDYQSFYTQGKSFAFAANGPIVFEAMFNVTDAATNQASWWVGLQSVTTTGGLASTGLPAANLSAAFFYKTKGAMGLKFLTSNATVNTKTVIPTVTGGATAYTVVSGQTYALGAFLDPNDGTTGIVTWYVSTIIAGAWVFVASGTQTVLLASLANMYAGFGIVCGAGGTAETLTIDYWQSYAARILI
jgi:hypothetical protein